MRFGDEYGRVTISSSATIDDAYGLITEPAQIMLPSLQQPDDQEEEQTEKEQAPKRETKQTPKKGNKVVQNPEVREYSDQEEEVLPSTSSTPVDVPRRTTRQTKAPDRYSPTVLYVTESEPVSYEEIMQLPQKEKEKWLKAIETELQSLKQLRVYEKVKCPEKKKIIVCRWIFRRKTDANGSERYRARLVAKGYLQNPGDYSELFSPVLKAETLRFVLAYSAKNKCVLRHLDVETAFLNAELEHEIYMEVPPGVESGHNNCWKLKKALYGLKQSPYQWNTHIKETLHKLGFKQGIADSCLFTRGKQILLAFVDDLLVVTQSDMENREILNMLSKHYEIRDLGTVRNYLGVEIQQVENGFKISQKQKIKLLVDQYRMQNCKGSRTPMIVGFEEDTNESQPSDMERYRS